MANQYGPWATSIGAFGNPQLSAFWRQRLTKLVPTSQTSPMLSRRSLLCLGAAGAVTVLLPTLRSTTATASDENPVAPDKKPSSGRIYVSAVWTGADKKPESAQGGIIAIDPATGRWDKITRGVGAVRVSPDGKRIALRKFVRTIGDTSGTPIDVLTHDLETGEETRLCDEEGNVSWSPDSKEIVVSQRKTGTWRASREGSRRLPIPETDAVCDWSRDGRWLVAESSRDNAPPLGEQIYRMRPDGSEQRRLTKEGRNLSPRFSPDSRQILYKRDYSSSKRDDFELHVMDVDGANDRVIVRNELLASFEEACWSPDGRCVAVVWTTWEVLNGEKVRRAGEASQFRIEVMDADGKNRRLLNLGDATMLQLDHIDWR